MSKTKTAPVPDDAYVDLEAAAEAERQADAERLQAAKTQWLTTASSDAYGPAGHILDLTDAEAAAAPEGLLIAPTPEQLAQRL